MLSPARFGKGEPIGGLRVIAKHGWFAARPSGTEDLLKLYAESVLGRDHLRRIRAHARELLERNLARSAA